VTWRSWVCTPPPHLAVHDDQAPHSLTSQSTAHLCELQDSDCAKTGQEAPPLAFTCTILRVCERTPPPQDMEQADQAPQADTAQSIGQARVLHACSSRKDGQPLPPKAAATLTERDEVCTPPPQGREHVDQADHEPTTQSTGQLC